MKHMTKRALALLLVLVTVLTVFPVMTSTAVAEEAEPVFTQEDYDALYVQNGLTMLMTAYTAEETAAIIEAGTWENKATAEGYAALTATLQNGTRTAWAAADKGIYFRFDEVADYTADATKTGIKFPAMALSAKSDALTDGDFAVEFVFEPTFVSKENSDGSFTVIPQDNVYDENGVIQGATATFGGTWGAYSSSRSSFAVAGFQACFFMPSVYYSESNGRYTGASSEFRVFYYKGPQGSCTQLSGGSSMFQHYPFGSYGYQFNTQGTTAPLWQVSAGRVLKDAIVIDSYTLSLNRTLKPAGAAYIPTEFTGKLGSAAISVNNGDGSAVGNTNQTLNRNYWTMEQLSEVYPDRSIFEAFYGLPATVYAVRAYNRTLNAAEVQQNHFADLASYFEVDLSVFLALSAEKKLEVYEALANMTFRHGSREQVENVILGVKGAAKSAYDELYVDNGLVMLLSAYSGTEAGFIAENGKITAWANKAGAGSAALVSTTNPWEARLGGGVGYNVYLEGGAKYRQRTNLQVVLTESVTEGDVTTVTTTTTKYATYRDDYTNGAAPWYDTATTTVSVKVGDADAVVTESDAHVSPTAAGAAVSLVDDGKQTTQYVYAKNQSGSTISSYLDLGVSTVDTTGNYTVEYATKLMAQNTYANPDVRSTTLHGDTFTTDRCTVKLGAFGAWLYVSGNTYNYRRLYNTRNMNADWGHGTGWNGDYASPWNADAITVSSHVVTNDKENSTATQVLYANGGQSVNTFHPVGVKDGKSNAMTYISTAVNAFYIARNVANTTYAVRVYNRALGADEVAWNYAVDLMAYYKIDVTGVNLLTQAEKDALAANLSRFSMNKGGKSEIQTIVSNAVAKVVPTAADMSVYDELYVTDDLAALFTAFDAKGSGIDLAAGTWTDKKSGLTVTLDDRTNAAEWNLGQNGKGVGYWFQSMKDLADGRYAIGMRLPTSVLTNGDLAVEYTFRVNPVENPDGTKEQIIRTGEKGNYQYSIGGNHTYGLYNGGNSSFTFAGLQLCQFQWDNYDGASMTVRTFYSSVAWGSMNSGTFAGPYLFGTKADGYSSDVAVLSIDRTVTEKTGEGEYNEASFTVYKNGASQATAKNGGTHAKQQNFYTIEELNASHSGSTAADAFYGVPATVYAIRIYTDDLTAAEKAQNYAVDLMAYFKLDVRGFAAADEAKKTAVYEAFASYTFNDADKVEEMQAAIDAAVAGIPVAEGVQVSTDGDALRIWASMDTAENVSMLGMTVTFKNGDEVVSSKSGTTQVAFESITSGGNTVTADELRAEYLYAAIVKGIPAGTYTVEVTPYVIMMDETTVTGETKSMELTFN